jgi:hypothetical protein
MARARNIKPSFFANEHLAECDPYARLLFAGLWCLADREGRLEDRPKRIRAELFPYDNCDADALLEQLQAHGFISRYAHGEHRFIQVLNFGKHQNPHVKEAKSTIPAQEEKELAPVEHSAGKVQASDENQKSPADSLIPDSLSSDSLIPDSLIPEEEPLQHAVAPAPQSNVKTLEPKPKAAKQKTEQQQANANTWDAYAAAYLDRYRVNPVRNAKVNAQIAQLVARLGAEEAPHVAAYFVTINDQFYLRSLHDFGLLVSKAEAIRTQWITGRQMNGTTARQIEGTQANVNAAQEAARLIRARGEGGKRNAFL